jgi:secondary thiamine-phosphate synthase enzyme
VLRQCSSTIAVTAPRQGLFEVTSSISAWLDEQDIESGLLTLFCRHTSASLLIQENAADAARRDLEAWFARIAPENRALYTHNDEGPDDMPAHIRAALTSTQLSVPIQNKRMVLGTWQGIYLFEHRREPSRREIALHLIGE